MLNVSISFANLLMWILVGGLAGWLASLVVRGGGLGLVGDILVGVIGADLPDLVYIPMIVFGKALYRFLPFYAPMIAFLGRIQWYEKPPGFITEIIWATLMLALLSRLLP